MGKLGLGLAAAAVLLSTTAQAQDRSPRNFTMSGPWSLDAGDDYCRLAASFTNGGDTIAFALERIEPAVHSRLILIGDAVTPFRGADVIGRAFQPGGEVAEVRFLKSETASGQAYFNLGMVVLPGAFGDTPATGSPDTPPAPKPYQRDAELAAAARFNGIALDEGLRQPINIQTGPLRAPIAALQSCTDDLLRIWGLDYAAHQTMRRPATPVGPVLDWVGSEALEYRDFNLVDGGQNSFRIMVSAEGRATACTVQAPSLPEEKNTAICAAVVANGRFTPAQNAAGDAMASYWMAPAINFARIVMQMRR